MSFRARLTVAAAAAVAAAVALASGALFLSTRAELRRQVDQALLNRASALRPQVVIENGRVVRIPAPPPIGEPGGYVQLVSSTGDVLRPESQRGPGLPVSNASIEVATGQRRAFLSDVYLAGRHLRVITAPFDAGVAIQVARSLEEVDEALRRLGIVLVLVTLAGVAAAAALGMLVTRAAVAPVKRLTEAAEHVTETTDLSQRIEASGSDELSRLAASFNSMLAALEASVDSQRQLVADASHELRTPLTSLRTNIEVLERSEDLQGPERDRLLKDVIVQIEELTMLVSDLVELARGTERRDHMEDVRLDEVVARAADRAAKHAPSVRFSTDLRPSLVRGAPERLDRALVNLLDNAAKWSPEGGTVEVAVRDAEVTVRDHGPGIDPSDLPFVFDRFYRAPSARGRPGSGLGLAIVRQIAESHGGSVAAESAEGGGALLRLKLLPAS